MILTWKTIGPAPNLPRLQVRMRPGLLPELIGRDWRLTMAAPEGKRTFPGFVKFLIESLGEGGADLAYSTYVAGAPIQQARELAEKLAEVGVRVGAPRQQAEVDRQAVLDKKAEKEAEKATEESK